MMEARTHWVFDDFFPEAAGMREKLEQHFDESIASGLSFRKRTIWNYWYIDKLYIYFRADPRDVFPESYEKFMTLLRYFAAREFGLTVANPFLSMYINGCGQGLHNDTKNGRLGYVFSLTKWKEKRFEGGETIIHKFTHDWNAAQFRSGAGTAFYELVEPEFNRLLLFDDRLPHAVRTIQGTMNPLDARFVMHGHLEESAQMAYVAGGLRATDIDSKWQGIKEEASRILQERGLHGFLTCETDVDTSGHGETSIKHSQLIPRDAERSDAWEDWAGVILQMIKDISWPKAVAPSKMIYALCSEVSAIS